MQSFRVERSGNDVKVYFPNDEIVSWCATTPSECVVTHFGHDDAYVVIAEMGTVLDVVDARRQFLSYLEFFEFFEQAKMLVVDAHYLLFNTSSATKWSVKTQVENNKMKVVSIVSLNTFKGVSYPREKRHSYVTHVTWDGNEGVMVKSLAGDFYCYMLTKQ